MWPKPVRNYRGLKQACFSLIKSKRVSLKLYHKVSHHKWKARIYFGLVTWTIKERGNKKGPERTIILNDNFSLWISSNSTTICHTLNNKGQIGATLILVKCVPVNFDAVSRMNCMSILSPDFSGYKYNYCQRLHQERILLILPACPLYVAHSLLLLCQFIHPLLDVKLFCNST